MIPVHYIMCGRMWCLTLFGFAYLEPFVGVGDCQKHPLIPKKAGDSLESHRPS